MLAKAENICLKLIETENLFSNLLHFNLINFKLV